MKVPCNIDRRGARLRLLVGNGLVWLGGGAGIALAFYKPEALTLPLGGLLLGAIVVGSFVIVQGRLSW